MAKLSVIVPVYNVEKYLQRCVDSLLAQTHEDLEILLVNDGSTDGSPALCDAYAKKDARIRVIHQKNGGLSAARNTGIDAATGEYLAFLDSDDYVDRATYSLLLREMQERRADIVGMQFERVSEDSPFPPTPKEPSLQATKISNEEYIKAMCSYRASCSFCDKVFKASVFDGYRFTVGKTNEDLLLLTTILAKERYDIWQTDYRGYYYLVREGSITKSHFGASITHTVYNCRQLQELIAAERGELYRSITELLLYQIRTFLILMPVEYIREKHPDFLFAKKLLHDNKQHIRGAFFSKKDKLFLRLCCISMPFAKKVANLINKK